MRLQPPGPLDAWPGNRDEGDGQPAPIDELQVDLAATVEGADAIGEAPNDTFQRGADAIGDVAGAELRPPQQSSTTVATTQRSLVLLREPTRRQLGRASSTAELATQPGVSEEHPM